MLLLAYTCFVGVIWISFAFAIQKQETSVSRLTKDHLKHLVFRTAEEIVNIFPPPAKDTETFLFLNEPG